MPDEQFKAPPDNEKAEKAEDGVMLKDILKPSNLIIALVASVLLILLGWYVFILKPAFSESNPLDITYTKPSKSISSNASGLNYVADNPAAGKVIVTSPARDGLSISSTEAATKKPEVVTVKRKAANSDKRATDQRVAASQSSQASGKVAKTQKGELSGVERFKSLFPPVTKPTCTQVQIAMNQCQQN